MSDNVLIALWAAAILAIIAGPGLLMARGERVGRCDTVCAPVEFTDCGRGHTICADGRLIWRTEGQP